MRSSGGMNLAWLTVLWNGTFFLFFWGLFWALVYASNKNCNEEKHGWAKIYMALAIVDIFGLILVILDRGSAALVGISLGQTVALALFVLTGVFVICAIENDAELSLAQKLQDPAVS